MNNELGWIIVLRHIQFQENVGKWFFSPVGVKCTLWRGLYRSDLVHIMLFQIQLKLKLVRYDPMETYGRCV